MTTEGETPRVDTGPDLEGCTGNHCHRPRSPRQEGSRNQDGIPYGCHRPAGWGTNHQGWGACKLHGGNTQTGIARADTIKRDAILAAYSTPVDVDPGEALLEEVGRSVGIVRFLARAVADELDLPDLTWGLALQTQEPRVTGGDNETLLFHISETYKAGTHPLVDLFMRERRHLREVARDAVAAGVSERMVNIYEHGADMFVNVLDRVLDALDLTGEQRAKVPSAVVRELRAIKGDG